MSFYVTLPSNVKKTSANSTFSNNNGEFSNLTSNYTTTLQNPLIFDRPYEVALVEMMYKHSWSIPVGRLKIQIYPHQNIGEFEATGEKYFDLNFYDGDYISDFVRRIQETVDFYFLEILYTNRYKRFRSKFARNPLAMPNTDEPRYPYDRYDLDKGVIAELEKTELFKRIPKFKIENEDRFVIRTYGNAYVEFTGQVSQILGMKNPLRLVQTKENNVYRSDHIYDMTPQLLQNLFIYTNIISYQKVGNTLSPLLKTVCVDNQPRQTAWAHYDNPQYLPVNKNEISSIELDIKDIYGKNIRFENSLVIIKLHFRPIN